MPHDLLTAKTCVAVLDEVEGIRSATEQVDGNVVREIVQHRLVILEATESDNCRPPSGYTALHVCRCHDMLPTCCEGMISACFW